MVWALYYYDYDRLFSKKMSQKKMPFKKGKPKSSKGKSSLSSAIKVAKGRRVQNDLE
jgi:hypothetical protein